MKINSINIKTNNVFMKKSQPTTATIKGINQEVLYEHFQEQERIEKQKNNILKAGIISANLILLGGLMLQIAMSSKGKSSKSLSVNNIATEFVSLKSDNSIPTLENCRSLNKKLYTFLKNQVRLINAGNKEDVKTANRLLMYGPQGSGKSYFSKIYAKTIGAEYLEVQHADFNSRWAGEGTEKFVAIFKRITEKATSNPDKKFVVTFNEIDTIIQPIEKIIPATGGGGTYFATKLEHRSVFLNNLEKLEEVAPNVIVIGTTNVSPKTLGLDGAVLSRFKRNIVQVDLPEVQPLYEALLYKLLNDNKTKDFAENNKPKLQKIANDMYNRKCSYRDVNSLYDISIESYTLDKFDKKGSSFSVKYLEDALKSIEMTDGEIYMINAKKG